MNTDLIQTTKEKPIRIKLFKWHFSIWKLSNFKLGFKLNKWGAGSIAIGKFVITYLRAWS